MHDGAIIFSTELDNKGLEKDLANAKKKIQRAEESIDTNQKMRSPLVESSKQMAVELDKAKAKLYEMQTAAEGVFSREQIADQRETVRSVQASWDSEQRKVERYDENIRKATIELEKNKAAAGEIEQQLASIGPAAQYMADATERAQKSAVKFKKRLKEVLRSALVFTLITKGMAMLRDWMGKVIRANDEASASVARLKGALLTLAQPLMQIVIPAFTALVNVLTAVVGRAAQLLSALFGTTAAKSAEAAEGLYEETKAIEGTGAAAKKASKFLAAFDEVNTVPEESSGGGAGAASSIAPDFEWAKEMSSFLREIADAVLLIAAGLALWKLSSMLPGVLGTIARTLGGILMIIGGLLLAWHGLTDAWENGVDWGNMAAMIGGVAAAAVGAYVAFGSLGAGIVLLAGGIALVVTAFKDMFENGMNVQNVLLAIAGIIGTGLGISLLTGNMIPLLIAGIASVLLAVTALSGNGQQLLDNLKAAFQGLSDFVKGVFTNDMELAGKGLENMLRGIANTALTLVGSLVNIIIRGLNWLIGKINSIRFTVPDWIPGVGGKSFSPSLRTFSEWTIPQLPYLATGAVIPPNREFLAVLGDQKHGTNIETPEALLRKIVREEGGGNGGMTVTLLRAILEAIEEGHDIVLDGKKVGRALQKSMAADARAGI